MAPKRESSVTVRLSDAEYAQLYRYAADWEMEVTEILRACLSLGLPVLERVEFARRIRLEDNKAMRRRQ